MRTSRGAPCAWAPGLAGLMACLIGSAAGADDDQTIGEWRTAADLRVQVQACGETVCARIVRLPDARTRDANNPDARLRMRPVLGIQIFTGRRRIGSGGWTGQMYIPDSGTSYEARLTVPRHDTLEVAICGPIGLLCTRETWTRTR